MLEYFRERMGPLLWVVLVLVIGGFVFMDGPTTGSLNFPTPVFAIEGDKVTDREAQNFAFNSLGIPLNADVEALTEELNNELATDTPDDKIIQDLEKRIEEAQRNLRTVSAYMAWDAELKKDGVRFSKSQIVDYLKKNPRVGWSVLGSEASALFNDEKLSPRSERRLENFAYQRQIQLHQILYQSCMTTPMSLAYFGVGGQSDFRYSTLQVTADLVELPLKDFEAISISYDEAKLVDFWQSRQNLERKENQVGYQKPTQYSLTILTAISSDFVNDVEVDIVSLRRHYEQFKFNKWMNNEEQETTEPTEPKPYPFIKVRAEVEADYRLFEGNRLAREHLEKAAKAWASDGDAQKIRDDFTLNLYNFEKLLLDDFKDLPDLKDAVQQINVASLNEGDLAETPLNFEKGSFIYRLNKKESGAVLDFEENKEIVAKDYKQDQINEIAKKAFEKFRIAWSQSQQMATAIASLTSDSVVSNSIESFTPKIKPLGILRPNKPPENLENAQYLLSSLMRAVHSGEGQASQVFVDLKNNTVQILIAKESLYGLTDGDGNVFQDVFEQNHKSVRGSFFQNYHNEYASMLLQFKVNNLR